MFLTYAKCVSHIVQRHVYHCSHRRTMHVVLLKFYNEKITLFENYLCLSSDPMALHGLAKGVEYYAASRCLMMHCETS